MRSLRVPIMAAVLSASTACAPARQGSVPPLDLARWRLVDLTHAFDARTPYWPTSPGGFRLERLSAGATPTLLLATGSAIQLETASGDVIEIPGREMLLLTEPATVRNTGGQPAMFVIARM